MFLLSLESLDCGAGPDGKRLVGANSPPVGATLRSVLLGVAFFFVTEGLCRYVLDNCQDFHPLIEIEQNRRILARHIGVDALGCFIVAYLGIKNGYICKAFYETALQGKNSLPAAAFDQRMFTYHPAAQQIALVFTMYQVKNTYDTIVFNDGPEFIFHHCLALVASWAGMYPGVGHEYVIFFFGMSEISTAILCLLANFDDEHGVVGLGDAFPVTKVAVGAVFVVFFILCRVIMWPYFSYHFVRDSMNAIQSKTKMSEERKVWLRILMTALSGLSVLQVLWLGQIFIIGKEEISKIL